MGIPHTSMFLDTTSVGLPLWNYKRRDCVIGVYISTPIYSFVISASGFGQTHKQIRTVNGKTGLMDACVYLLNFVSLLGQIFLTKVSLRE